MHHTDDAAAAAAALCQLLSRQGPIHYSNAMLVDPETKKPVRVQYRWEDKAPYRKVGPWISRIAR